MSRTPHRSHGRSPALRATALVAGSVVAAATLIDAAPARAALPDPVPVVQVQDVALTAFDTGDFITTGELAVANILRALSRVFDVNDLPVSGLLTDFGVGSLTPNDLLNFTGLGDVKLSDLLGLANIIGFGSNPLSVLLAAAGVSDSTTLSSEIAKLGIGDQPLSNFYNLIGLHDYQTATLGDLASALGVGNDPVSNLFGVLGLNGDSTLSEAVAAFGIGDTQLDTLLADWGVGTQDIDPFLHDLGVSPQELLQIFDIDPDTLPASVWDSATDSFASGATVQEFADAAGLGHLDVDGLLSAGHFGDASLDDLLTGVGLSDDATVNQVLSTIGFNDVKIWDFLNGFGVYSGPDDQTATLNDFFTAIPGLQHTTIGGLLGALGLSDHSTINDLFTSLPALGDNTLSDVVGDFGLGDTSLSDLATDALGDTSVDTWLTDIMSALVTG
jgi:hypothetical protein